MLISVPSTSILDPSGWTYVLLSGSFRDPSLRSYYIGAYELWRDVWLETFRDLEGADRIASDNFSRQDEIGGLFFGTKCLMLSGFRHVDLSLTATKDDSYFSTWPAEAMSALARDGNRILIGNQITLAAEVRGKNAPVSMKDLIVSLSIARLIDSENDAMAGTMRNNKGMNTLASRHGATLVRDASTLHGIKVDLFAFYQRDYAETGVRHLAPLTHRLWDTRVVDASLTVGNPRKNQKAA